MKFDIEKKGIPLCQLENTSQLHKLPWRCDQKLVAREVSQLTQKGVLLEQALKIWPYCVIKLSQAPCNGEKKTEILYAYVRTPKIFPSPLDFTRSQIKRITWKPQKDNLKKCWIIVPKIIHYEENVIDNLKKKRQKSQNFYGKFIACYLV